MMPNISELLKKHWIAASVAGIGILIIYRYSTGSSAAQQTSSENNMAAYYNAQAAMSAQNAQVQAQLQAQSMQYGLAEDQINAQLQISNNQAISQQAQATGSAIAGIISAQSQIPAMAINAATANNQTALQQAAQVAIAGINALPNAMQAQANQIVATSQQFNSYLNATGQAQASFNSSMPILINSIAQSAAQQTSGVANAASTSANANAALGGAMWNTVGTVGMAALMA